MENLPVQQTERRIATQGTVGVEDLLRAWLSGRSARTIKAYGQDLHRFASFVGVDDINDAARALLGRSHGDANYIALAYRNHMRDEEHLAPATVNRRLAALRSLVTLAQTLGLVDWTLNVSNIKSRPLRDTRGCGIDGVRRLLKAAGDQRNPGKRARDRAVVRLLFDLGLRRMELVGLDIEHVDLDGARLWVLGKGHSEREAMSLPDETASALRAWLEVRGEDEGSLFVNFDRNTKGQPLSDSGLYKVIKALGKRAGVQVRPHGIRHAAVTTLLDLTNGDVRTAQRFARHASPQTTIQYDDARRDVGGDGARTLAAAV
jgi:integrase/recombinase XerC